MKLIKQSPMGSKRKGGILLAAVFGSLMFSHSALANTSAGTQLVNSVTVDYDDASGTAQTQETDTVTVTVDHLASVAWGAAPAGQTVSSGQTLASAYTITLTNTGNGSDSYGIVQTSTESCTTGTLGEESFSAPTPVVLGATVSSGAGVYAAVPDETTIPVSNISNAADFAATDIVVINGTQYTVVSASSDGDATTPDSLVVSGDASTDVAAAGVQIGERQVYSFGATGNAGTLSAGATGCTHAHSIVATGTTETGGNAAATDTVNGWSTTVEGALLTVTKYVRNTLAAGNTSGVGAFQYQGAGPTYYTGGVTGNPGDTLEYLVVITNGSAGTATNVVFGDTLPSFTTYVDNSIAVDTNGDGTFDQTVSAVAGPGLDTEADGEAGGIIVQSGSAIDVYPGAGGDEVGDTGGTILDVTENGNDPSNETAVRYQITID